MLSIQNLVRLNNAALHAEHDLINLVKKDFEFELIFGIISFSSTITTVERKYGGSSAADVYAVCIQATRLASGHSDLCNQPVNEDCNYATCLSKALTSSLL